MLVLVPGSRVSQAAPMFSAKVSAPFLLAGGPGKQQEASMAGHVMAYADCVGGNCDIKALDLSTHKVVTVAGHVWDEQEPSTDGSGWCRQE